MCMHVNVGAVCACIHTLDIYFYPNNRIFPKQESPNCEGQPYQYSSSVISSPSTLNSDRHILQTCIYAGLGRLQEKLGESNAANVTCV